MSDTDSTRSLGLRVSSTAEGFSHASFEFPEKEIHRGKRRNLQFHQTEQSCKGANPDNLRFPLSFPTSHVPLPPVLCFPPIFFKTIYMQARDPLFWPGIRQAWNDSKTLSSLHQLATNELAEKKNPIWSFPLVLPPNVPRPVPHIPAHVDDWMVVGGIWQHNVSLARVVSTFLRARRSCAYRQLYRSPAFVPKLRYNLLRFCGFSMLEELPPMTTVTHLEYSGRHIYICSFNCKRIENRSCILGLR